METKRACKCSFYPTPEPEALLAQLFGCAHFVANSVLPWRADEFCQRGYKVHYTAASEQLTDKKLPELQWLNDVSSVPLQQALRHQQEAFKNFCTPGAHKDGRAKCPKFKKKNSRQSASSALSMKEGQVFIAKNKEPLNILWSQPLPSEPSSVRMSNNLLQAINDCKMVCRTM